MIVLDLEQGTQEWLQARCGTPSASKFDMIVTSTGSPSKQAKKYLYQLAGERVIGKPVESYKSAAMERGIEMEGEAADLYELLTDAEVKRVGICYSDEVKAFSCSPDRLIGEDGLLEIKCPEIHTHVEYLLSGTAPTDYFQQLQGQLLVTGREWVDFMSYYPGLKPLIVRVKRDEKFLSALKGELETFCNELAAVTEKLSVA